VYWAAGGRFWLPGGARTAGLADLRAANWGVSILLAIGAIFLLALARHWPWLTCRSRYPDGS